METFKRVRIFELRTQPKWKARGQEEPTEHEMPSKEAPSKTGSDFDLGCGPPA